MNKGFTLIELMIVVAIVGVIIAIVCGGVQDVKKKEQFMAECKQDHKQYECDSMWATAHPQPHVVNVYHN